MVPCKLREENTSEPRGNPEPVFCAETLRALAAVDEIATCLAALAEDEEARRSVPGAAAQHLHIQGANLPIGHHGWS